MMSLPLCFVVYEENENYEFSKHEKHMLKDVTFFLPKFDLHDPLIRGTHGESLVKHEYFFEHCMRHDVLSFLVHDLGISLLVFNPHWIHLAMEFVLKGPRSKRRNHFHLTSFGSFLSLCLYLIQEDG